MLEWSTVMTLGIGIAGSSVIHFSQGLMKLGIWRGQHGHANTRTRWIYRSGMILNFTAPFWVVLANRFGPTALYTSMYAVGLLPLLAFSRIQFNHHAAPMEIVGLVLIVLASPLLAFGVTQVGVAHASREGVQILLWVGLLLPICLVLVLPLARTFRWPPEGLLWGGVGGGFLALDSLLKGIAQADGGVAGFLPATADGFWLFALSFIGAGIAFGMTQWAHVRGAAPSHTIAAYDAGYILLPILLVPLLNTNASLNNYCLLGVALTVAGIVTLSFSKSS